VGDGELIPRPMGSYLAPNPPIQAGYASLVALQLILCWAYFFSYPGQTKLTNNSSPAIAYIGPLAGRENHNDNS